MGLNADPSLIRGLKGSAGLALFTVLLAPRRVRLYPQLTPPLSVKPDSYGDDYSQGL